MKICIMILVIFREFFSGVSLTKSWQFDYRRQIVLKSTKETLDQHIDVNDAYFQLLYLQRSPDIILVNNFLTSEECESIIETAKSRDMRKSPVAYAGWSQDAKEMLKLLAGGPAVWFSLINISIQSHNEMNSFILLSYALSTWLFSMLLFAAIVGLSGWQRLSKLETLRTSTSTILDGTGFGDSSLIKKAVTLLCSDWKTFEAPTVIHYTAGQYLKPHFDANVAASVEDSLRGGQTLCTLLVYCNNVDESDGGATYFNKLGLSVQPKKGQALIFFPANKFGHFDERMEHEGISSKNEKWVVRIWKHENRVFPPYGLPDSYKSN